MVDKEYVPEHIQDMIFDEYIKRLLHDVRDDEGDEPERPFNPYSLDSKVPLRFLEPEPVHEVKKPAPAYRKTKLPSNPIVECEFMREVNGQLDLSGIYATTDDLIAVSISGSDEKFYVAASSLKRLLRDSVMRVMLRPCDGGTAAVAMIDADQQVLLDSAGNKVV